MGYQVGNQCFESRGLAENHYYSLVAPVLTPDGKLVQPEYLGNEWKLNGQVLQAKLPQCDPDENLKAGMELGWYFVAVMAAMWVFNVLRRIIR